MKKIALVTDSTSSFRPEWAGDQLVVVLPVYVIWDGIAYRDGVDLQPEEFYQRYRLSKSNPTTSQPSMRDFHDVYDNLLAKGYQVISYHLSEKLSGTVQTACQAASAFPANLIRVVDSKVISVAASLAMMEVLEAIRQGKVFEECVALAERMARRFGIFLMVETLDALTRGGRLSKREALAGSLLSIKPILSVRNGELVPLAKVPTMKLAVRQLKKIFAKELNGATPRYFGMAYTSDEDRAQQVLHEIIDMVDPGATARVFSAPLSPAVGAHTGPGSYGVGYLL